jgi:hypothetical protein
VAHVEVAPSASHALDLMIADLDLPSDTRERVRQRLIQLRTFPESAPAKRDGRWAGYRALIGPWLWMILVYRFIEADDLVRVVAIVDSRGRA